MNQAGGKSITGIFANAAKAFNVMYIANKLSGKSIEDVSNIWKLFAAAINASVDNANEGIWGAMNVNSYNAPYIGLMIAQGYSFDAINSFLNSNEGKAFFTSMAKAGEYDSKEYFNPDGIFSPELVALYYQNSEWSMLTKSLINRDIPTTAEGVMSHIISIEKYINSSYSLEVKEETLIMKNSFQVKRVIKNM